MEISEKKLIYYVDIDFTVCITPESNDYTQSEPIYENIDKINKLYNKKNIIVYWTARGTKTGIDYYDITKEQLDSWGCMYDRLIMGKPCYDYIIDDRAIKIEEL